MTNPWVSLTGWLVGFISLGVTIYAYHTTKRFKAIVYSIDSLNIISKEIGNFANIQVLMNGENIQSLKIINVNFVVIGRDAIRKNDIRKNDPFRVVLKNGILYDLGFEDNNLGINPIRQNKSIIIDFSDLDQGDSFTISLLCNEESLESDIQVEGKILECKIIEKRKENINDVIDVVLDSSDYLMPNYIRFIYRIISHYKK
ncbi:hypothetical protein GCM10008938_48560 [Deinococcus roseus]|uniref:Uncharacterized protein n=2 Tax=Deinococcus roseus TaxID=392414 RepID=A0ABQ2DIQ1_9DEIO|nr:hypothetical protein GCM10008938_48560 [Deinococcus roseus]